MALPNKPLGELPAVANPENAGQWLLVSGAMFQQINLGYGREAELESDAQGMLTSTESGYHPAGIVKFLKNLRRQEIMTGQAYHSFQATHPDLVIEVLHKKREGKGGIRDFLTSASAVAPAVVPDLIALDTNTLVDIAHEGLIIPLDGFLSPALLTDLYPFVLSFA